MSIHSQYITGRKVIYLTNLFVYKDANIFSTYNLCSSIPFEELTASLSSAYTLSLLFVELVSSPGAAVTFLATVLNPAEVAAPASVYSLSTAVT